MPRRLRAARAARAARTALFALVVVLVAGILTGTPAGATAWGGTDPAHNIAPVPSLVGSICETQPFGAACRTRIVQALDRARETLGLRPYVLPDRFAWLAPRERMLLLLNQDRQSVGLAPVRGMNAALNSHAGAGIPRREDPLPMTILGGEHWLSWAANWAGGSGAYASPLSAHYDWMYYDGLNADGSSWNRLCTRTTLSYCWKHRHNVLLRPGTGQQIAVGLATGPDGHGEEGSTQLLETVRASAPVSYVPTVVRVSARTAPRTGGGILTIGGFGFVRVRSVLVLGANAPVLSATSWTLRVRLPAHAPGYGHIVVTTTGGTSSANYAAGFRYLP
jgi:hypothetical protein